MLGTSAGGTGAHVAMLAEGCAHGGEAVTVFAPAATWAAVGSAPAMDTPPVAFRQLEIAARPRPARDLAAVLRLRRLLRSSAPDVVHAHGLRAGALAALAVPRHTVLVVTVHNAPPAGGGAGLVYSLLERIAARRADAVTWVSADLAARMLRRGARDGGRALVPAPPAGEPSAADVAKARADLGGNGRPVVLAAGRLAAQKGFGVLLAAAADWQDRDPPPVLAIAGEGPLAGALADQASAARLTVRFLGQRTDVPALLAAADVVVVPSLWEGQPLIVQEAMRAGRPLVAARVGGIPELTGEDGAMLVPPADAGALAAAVLSVLADPRRAAELGSAARRRAAGLPSVPSAVDAVLGLYQRLLTRQAGRP